MNKRKYIMFTMIIISALSILEWGISFSPIFLIVSNKQERRSDPDNSNNTLIYVFSIEVRLFIKLFRSSSFK